MYGRDNGLPVIKLEVERMRQTMLMHLSEHAAKVDADLRAAVDKFLAEGHVTRIINETAAAQLTRTIEEETRKFFSYGEGGRIIREVVNDALTQSFAKVMQPVDGKKPTPRTRR
jgi:hypothetical protein